MEAAKRYLKEVGRVLRGPVRSYASGGPILMVQVENEHGFFGKDADYMGELRQSPFRWGASKRHSLPATRPRISRMGSGPTCSCSRELWFGSGQWISRRCETSQPKAPLMCGEFYPGWFDTWGAPHHTGNTPRYLADSGIHAEDRHFLVQHLYGPRRDDLRLWTGADRPFKPDTSEATTTMRRSAKRVGSTEKVFQNARPICPLPASRRNDSPASRPGTR